jgi:hypothetical protein
MVHARMVIARDPMMVTTRIFHALTHAVREKLRSKIECSAAVCAVGNVCYRTPDDTVGCATREEIVVTQRTAHTIDTGCRVCLALHKAARTGRGE